MKDYAYLGRDTGIMKLDGILYYFNVRDSGMINLLMHDNVYEPDLWMTLPALVPMNATFVDIGASVGIHTLRVARKLRGSGRIISYEPNPTIFTNLYNNCQINGFARQVECRQKAVHDGAGQLALIIEANAHREARLRLLDEPASTSSAAHQTIETMVETVRIDDDLADLGPEPVVLKIDVEGREQFVVRGARQLFSDHEDVRIVFEYSSDLTYDASCSIHEISETLASEGFSFYLPKGLGFDPITRKSMEALDRHVNLVAARHPLPAPTP